MDIIWLDNIECASLFAFQHYGLTIQYVVLIMKGLLQQTITMKVSSRIIGIMKTEDFLKKIFKIRICKYFVSSEWDCI